MGKRKYLKPTLVKQVVGVMNKFGNSWQHNTKEEIDNVPVTELIEKYGSPLFVFSEKKLRSQFRKLSNAFKTRYPQIQFSWSYKTNYLGAICSVLHQEGEIAEVVSGFEYEKARKLGMPGDKIVFNGPWKKDEELALAFKEGAIVNLDGFDELHRAEKVAEKIGKKVKVGIRLNMDTGTYPKWSKFGFNLETTQAYEAASRIMKSDWLTLAGLHAHIGTFMLEPNAYSMQITKMVKFMLRLESEYQITLDYLDIGGGFPSKNRLKGIYLPPDVSVPEIDAYADAICTALEKTLPAGRFPKLYLETGRHVVDESGSLITTVIAEKPLPTGGNGYFLDAGIGFLYTSEWYNFNVTPAKRLDGTPEQCTLYGPLCMNIDVVEESIYLPPIPVGTPLVVAPVGAYNVTQWMQFIMYRPNIVMIMEDGTTEIIRRAEKLEDVIGCENIPDKLKF